MELELIADYGCVTGEGPLWHAAEQRLYWSDIPTGRMFRYDPVTGKHEQFYEGEVVGGFTVQADGSLLLFRARGAVVIWRDGAERTVIPDLPDELESRFNDVQADPRGRVFCGTMSSPTHPGRLYLLETDGSIETVIEGTGTSNGMGFTLDGRSFYHTDSRTRRITQYDYDEGSGRISNGRVALETPAGEGVPDGMTVDAEGFIWSARWDGGALFRYAPDGAEVLRVPFPARRVSSVTFGGPEYRDVYVTTAGGEDKAAHGPGAGGLYRLRGGVVGLPEPLSRVLL